METDTADSDESMSAVNQSNIMYTSVYSSALICLLNQARTHFHGRRLSAPESLPGTQRAALNHLFTDKQQHTIIRLCRFMFGVTVMQFINVRRYESTQT